MMPLTMPGAPRLPSEQWPPATGAVCEFVVLGHPVTAGSKTAGIVRRGDGSMVMRNGRPLVVARDSSGARGEAWRSDVAVAGERAFDAPRLSGPLAVELTFVLQRPKGHYRTGRNAHLLRDFAPPAPGVKPDGLKLARAVEDALTSVVWVDDAQIVDERIRKVYGAPERVEIRVWQLAGVGALVGLDLAQLELAA